MLEHNGFCRTAIPERIFQGCSCGISSRGLEVSLLRSGVLAAEDARKGNCECVLVHDLLPQQDSTFGCGFK
jgi:hypothetical protein